MCDLAFALFVSFIDVKGVESRFFKLFKSDSDSDSRCLRLPTMTPTPGPARPAVFKNTPGRLYSGTMLF